MAIEFGRRVDGADRFVSVDRTGWRDLLLHLLVRPRSTASITSIFLSVIFLSMFGLLVVSPNLLAPWNRFVLDYFRRRFDSLQAGLVPFAVGTKR